MRFEYVNEGFQEHEGGIKGWGENATPTHTPYIHLIS